MKRFKVKLHGENFLLNFDGELKKVGFYATTFVKAENPQEVEKMAVILIHRHPNLRDTVLNESTDRPTINIEEIEEVNPLKFFAKKNRQHALCSIPKMRNRFLLVCRNRPQTTSS